MTHVKKFWTSQDGKLGTAHINREELVVDFRAAILYKVDTQNNAYFVSKDGENNYLQLKYDVLEYKYDLDDWNCQFSGKGIASKIKVYFGHENLVYQGKETLYIQVELPAEIQNLLFLKRVERQNQEKEEKERARQDSILFKDHFESVLKSTTLNRKQKNWILSFLKDKKKAEQQVIDFIHSLPGGERYISIVGYEQIHTELSKVFS